MRQFVPLWVSNEVVVTATPDVVRELAQQPGIERITSDAVDIVETGDPVATPEPNVALIGAPTLWDLGHDGAGVVVAVLDSGVDITNPDLSASYRGGTNSWFDPYGQHTAGPVDLSGHGTATTGVAVGGGSGGTSIGVAPGATWIAGRVFNDAGTATASAIHLALQWVLDPDGDPTTADAPAVVNNSWAFGTPGCNLEFQADLQALRAADIVPVFAAGNYGPGAATSVSPANYPEALSVGATTNSDTIYAYSGRGPSACGQPSTTYPDLVAPGVNIWSSDRGGLFSGCWRAPASRAPTVRRTRWSARRSTWAPWGRTTPSVRVASTSPRRTPRW
ncbi:MAG: S8 family serine peptidase [Actinobacteria bacterium]|nr:S8 family serine peptidase [Actinomycetota bacterium]